MFRKKVILNIGAWLMLFAFLVNSVPKRYIHDRIANHKHEAKAKQDQTKAHFDNKTCECEKYFTETAFAKDAQCFQIWVSPTSFIPTSKVITPCFSTIGYIDLRGPPTV